MKRSIVAPVIIVVMAISIGIWWFINSSEPEASPNIFASGFIEATDVTITPEVIGRITAISAEEGDVVTAGEILVSMDDSLLNAQLKEAEATLHTAQAGLEKAVVSMEQAVVSKEQAVISRDGARKVWEDAVDLQQNPLELDGKIIAVEGEIAQLELDLERAGRESRTWGKWDERMAKIRLDTAQQSLQNLLAIKENPQEVNSLVDETFNAYQTAAKAVDVADKMVEVMEKTVQVTEREEAQANAAIETLKVRLAKLALESPISGIVAEKYAEVGEMAQPGAAIMTVTEIEKVTLTAYVAESKIGLVKLGQRVEVFVDSYPGELFLAEVVYISPRALFTPKNIQLKEDREKTVFAVKMELTNTERKLKPGMPADAEILIDGN